MVLFILLAGCTPALQVTGDLNDEMINVTLDGSGTVDYTTPDGRRVILTTQTKKEPSLIRTIFEAMLFKQVNKENPGEL